jgi:hypothetical protein
MKSHKKLTTASGRPYVENENSALLVFGGICCCRITFFMRKWPISIGSAFRKEWLSKPKLFPEQF